jgi:hypothetical protein
MNCNRHLELCMARIQARTVWYSYAQPAVSTLISQRCDVKFTGTYENVTPRNSLGSKNENVGVGGEEPSTVNIPTAVCT